MRYAWGVRLDRRCTIAKIEGESQSIAIGVRRPRCIQRHYLAYLRLLRCHSHAAHWGAIRHGGSGAAQRVGVCRQSLREPYGLCIITGIKHPACLQIAFFQVGKWTWCTVCFTSDPGIIYRLPRSVKLRDCPWLLNDAPSNGQPRNHHKTEVTKITPHVSQYHTEPSSL